MVFAVLIVGPLSDTIYADDNSNGTNTSNSTNTTPPPVGDNTHLVSAGTNFIPLETWDTVVASNWAPSYIDTTVTHNGHSSIRQEGLIKNGQYLVREINRGWTSEANSSLVLTVKAGDIITISAWMKCNPSTVGISSISNSVHVGARIGCDFWASDTVGGFSNSHPNTATNHEAGWIDGIAYACQGGVPSTTWYSSENVHNWYVPMGSGWTYREMKFTVPTGQWGALNEIAYSQIQGMIIWFGVYCTDADGNKLNEMGTVWMSEPTLTIQRGSTSLSVLSGFPSLDVNGVNYLPLVISIGVLAFLFVNNKKMHKISWRKLF